NTGAFRDGQFRLGTVIERHFVIAGMSLLLVMREARNKLAGLIRCADCFAPWQDRHVAVDRASSAADVRQTESANGFVAVVIPAVRTGVRTPLNHAERKSCARKSITVCARADECINRVVCR